MTALKKPFSVIPVMDLMQGQAVHAQRGQRQAYQPLRSMLCEGSDPLIVALALLALHPFRIFYIADLDAITRIGSHRTLIEILAAQHPNVQWWVDDGSSKPWLNKPPNVMQVLGTESYPAVELFTQDFVLSLDERNGELLGDTELHHNTSRWPKRMIAMTLAQVGMNNGVNNQLINKYCTQHPLHEWYAAGGVRHANDLHELKAIGARGALVATALHSLQLKSHELAALEIT